MADDSLPKSTIAKAIKERMPDNMKIAAEAVDLIVKCCNEFVHMVSTQANEVSEKEKKTTITPEHVIKALEELGLNPYLPDVQTAYDEFKDEKKEAAERAQSRKQAKGNNTMTTEELAELQAKLFAQARERTLDEEPSTDPPAPEAS